MNMLVAALLLAVAIINALPVAGAISQAAIEAAYGVRLGGSDLAILMRHRALLFAIVAGLLIAAAFMPQFRGIAVAAALFSMASFIIIALAEGGFGAPIRRVIYADVIGIVLLGAAWFIHRLPGDIA